MNAVVKDMERVAQLMEDPTIGAASEEVVDGEASKGSTTNQEIHRGGTDPQRTHRFEK